MSSGSESDHYPRSDRLDQKSDSRNYHTPELASLLEAFERLAAIQESVVLCVQFEQEQRKSKLRLSTFRSAWTAWKAGKGSSADGC